MRALMSAEEHAVISHNFCSNCTLYMTRYHYLWANQHGWLIRHFCECGQYYDVLTLHSEHGSRVTRTGNLLHETTLYVSDIPF